MHDLYRDVLEEFAEAQRKGVKRRREFRWDQGFRIQKGMLGACPKCGLPMGQHAQWGCRSQSITQAYANPRTPYDWTDEQAAAYAKARRIKMKATKDHGGIKEKASAAE